MKYMNKDAATYKIDTALDMIAMNVKCLETKSAKSVQSVHFWIETWIEEVTDANALYTEWESSKL